MSFLSPLFLVGALAAAVPVLLHLLKRHPDLRVKFSAVHLLTSAPVEHASRRHLRELLLLALRVAALLLLALAFARPFFASSLADSSGAVVVAIDTSFSMSAPGQFEKARTLARQAVDSAGAGQLSGVVTFADAAQVASHLSGDRGLARAAIDAARPGLGATRYRAALLSAADLLRGRAGTIVVVTDLQAGGWDPGDHVSIPSTVQVEIADVGPAAANLAVTSARVIGDRLVATVRNTGARQADARVLVAAGSGTNLIAASAVVAAEKTVPVAAGQSADLSFAVPAGQWASVRVDDADGAAADNVRYVVLDSASRARVLVVSATGELAREAFYLEQALIARGPEDAAAYEVEGVAGDALQSWDQDRLDAHTALVLLSTRGLEHKGRALIGDFVRRGGGLIVATGTEVDGDVLSETLGGLKVSVGGPPAAGSSRGPTAGPTAGTPASTNASTTRVLAPVDGRHPLFRGFSGRSSLGQVTFQRVSAIRADGCATLARFTTGESALVECEPGAGRALLFASDLDSKENDFPRHATFLPFMHEAVRYVSGVRRSSEYLVATIPPGVPAVAGVVMTPGLAGAAGQLAAVNVDPVESDSARLGAQEFLSAVAADAAPTAGVPRAAAREREERQHVWQYVLAIMIAVMAAESVIATRTA